jgi:hypothetical protein
VINEFGCAGRPGGRPTIGGRSAGARPGRPALGALVALAAVAVTACSTAIGGQSAAAPGSAPTTTAAASTATSTAARPSAAAPTGPTAAPDTAVLDPAAAADRLRPFLLAPADVGPGFGPGQEPVPDPSVPAICGGPGVVAQFPSAVRVGVGLVGPSDGVLVQETVSVYGDGATAAAAYRANVDGLSCSEGTAPDGPVVLTPAEDLSVDVPADESTGWQIGGTGYDLVLIAVRKDEVVMNFAFVAPQGRSAGLPDPLAISRTGVQKLTG